MVRREDFRVEDLVDEEVLAELSDFDLLAENDVPQPRDQPRGPDGLVERVEPLGCFAVDLHRLVEHAVLDVLRDREDQVVQPFDGFEDLGFVAQLDELLVALRDLVQRVAQVRPGFFDPLLRADDGVVYRVEVFLVMGRVRRRTEAA